jgi:hypothetical protein
MKINKNETKHKLLNILKDGKERTFEDIVRLLMDENKRNETKHKILNTLKDGKERTFEDIVRLLMDENKRKL